ncbi:hypothetical protein [Haloterrigena alkaliphila]|uniref:Uncharacterized protein n=1 Tax=Haloterrigena alkaliphila TaxID=2816475 RepID=A0A8A2VJ58_9EURY|nr:hypothetical protein [Haloterrigena alkaliphila]QSX00741.1 hypothetical protein J0X25_07225 [Haloterrigena alkaliphila]
MTEWESSESAPEDEIRRKFNALDRRISRLEKMHKQILDQIRKMNARKGDGPTLEAWSNPDLTHHVLSIVKELETDAQGAHIDEIKQVAAEEGELKTETKLELKSLAEDGYVLQKGDRYRFMKTPEDDRAHEAEHPEEAQLDFDEDDIDTL